ncbi:MAG: hypothetical protein U0L61_06725 [Alistipes sp.]|nr:hypothetical protein [Alistipes sp.]
MIKPYRIAQKELEYIYENAQARMEYNPKRAANATNIVNNHPHFNTQKEALEFAVEQMKTNAACYQVWAKVEKGEDDIYKVQNWWLSTDDSKVLESAEYIGMVQTHDGSMILSIIDNNIPIDDVVAYY